MPHSPPVVGIYARKSKFSEMSESVANQVSLCREHCERVFPGCKFLIYDEDEGFSGKDTNRPSFQRLIADIKARKVNVLCCYRLDRISRSIRDFCNLLDDLQRYNVAFVSLRDQFDTSTPMGRAMLYIASVFSQLERETLAERVRDALFEMAKTGRWLGGQTPTGFTAATVDASRDGVTRKVWRLVPDEPRLAEVLGIYLKYHELGSLTKLQQHCYTCGIKSAHGKDFTRFTLRKLLTNPVYCTADDEAYQWFSSGRYSFCANREDFDGKRGIMPFNRTYKAPSAITVTKPTSEWIIAVGLHDGTVPGSVWVETQRMLESNKDLGAGYRAPRTELALLSGVVRCAECGSYMRPRRYGKEQPDGTFRFHYVCAKKVETRKAGCDICNAPYDIDDIVVGYLRSLSKHFAGLDGSESSSLIDPAAGNSEEMIRKLQSEIAAAQRRIDNMVSTIADGVPVTVRDRLVQQMDELDTDIQQKQKAIAELTNTVMAANSEKDLQKHISRFFVSFDEAFDAASYDEKRRLIRSVVDSVIWDGENITINVLGGKTLPK